MIRLITKNNKNNEVPAEARRISAGTFCCLCNDYDVIMKGKNTLICLCYA